MLCDVDHRAFFCFEQVSHNSQGSLIYLDTRGKGVCQLSMKKWIRKIKRKTAQALDIPSDVILDMPRITVVGFLQIYIENHHGVLLFTDQELRLLLKKGQLIIRGQNLVIRMITSHELFVEGIILAIQVME